MKSNSDQLQDDPGDGIASKDFKVAVTNTLKDMKINIFTMKEKIGNLRREILFDYYSNSIIISRPKNYTLSSLDELNGRMKMSEKEIKDQ